MAGASAPAGADENKPVDGGLQKRPDLPIVGENQAMEPLVNLNRFERALAEVDDVSELKRMHDQLEAVHRLARRMDLALEDQNRIAELRIRTARKAGGILAKTVRRGGKSNSHGGSSTPLPDGISWNQSSRWQELSRVKNDLLASYLHEATENRVEVTVAGFMRVAKAGSLEPLFSSATSNWLTPRAVVNAVVATLGGIDLDPCADPRRSIPAKTHYTEKDDGLSKQWSGRVFMSPPYGSQVPAWVERLVDDFVASRVTTAIALLPSRTDTAWFRVLRHYPRCFIEGRLRFSDHESGAPFPSMAVYLGRAPRRFQRVFTAFGDVYELVS